ncbi:MAG TPA: YjhG/YagF family D-xylonate dehydratase [Rhodothermales bacterium]|nr:YjhG/YagF family D-xylonate dehydratase [Rhodothermales bacterium]
MPDASVVDDLLFPPDPSVLAVKTHGPGPEGRLPVTADELRETSSGNLFALTQNIGMGWQASEANRKPFLILSTSGGVRAPDGTPIALGYHTGHWEIGLLVEEAAHEIRRLGAIPFAGFCSDPCDGRIQGTAGMMDSLPYRNDAAIVLRRLARCLPTRRGVMGVATCDKGLPAMMMALAALRDLPGVLVPGGVTLPTTHGEDLGAVQSLSARFAQGEISLDYAQEMGCKACGSPGGGCQFLGTAATSQVVAEALGLTVIHAALAPSGQPIWKTMARISARALIEMERQKRRMPDILTEAALRNAMVVHAAFGGSTNLLLHIAAIAHAAGLPRPTVEDWIDINRQVPRLVDVLPNGPAGHPTVRVFLAGGVPEVMLHLREMDLLDLNVETASGEKLGPLLDRWKTSERRARLREVLYKEDGIDPDDVIMNPARARERGLTSTVTFPRGNLAPEGSVIKSTAIDLSVVDADGAYRMRGPARVFTREPDAIKAIKSGAVQAGDIVVLLCAGPMGSGMEETYQVTAALKHLTWGKQVALITDARFSGVSTGACIGHVGPEALAGGPIGKVQEGDIIDIMIDRNRLDGSLHLIGEISDAPEIWSIERGNVLLTNRQPRPDLAPRADLPDATRLWAALQEASGGTWGGCVYDVDRIIELLRIGMQQAPASSSPTSLPT